MDAARDRLIQLLVQFRETAPQEMRLRSDVQRRVIIGSLDPINSQVLRNNPGPTLLTTRRSTDVSGFRLRASLVLTRSTVRSNRAVSNGFRRYA